MESFNIKVRLHQSDVSIYGGNMMSIKIVIVVAIIALTVGFFLGLNYQNIDSPIERKNVEKINAIYSIEYIPDVQSETIGINIFSSGNPTGLLKQKIVLNKYEIFSYYSSGRDQSVSLSFEGYSSEGKPIIRNINDFPEEVEYKEKIYNMCGYYPEKIIRSGE